MRYGGKLYRDGRDAMSLRIQYRDHEGIFVTITDENNVQGQASVLSKTGIVDEKLSVLYTSHAFSSKALKSNAGDTLSNILFSRQKSGFHYS